MSQENKVNFLLPEGEPILELGVIDERAGKFIWGKPLDLRLNTIFGPGSKTVRRYTIINRDRGRPHDNTAASGKGRYVTLRRGKEPYLLENRSTIVSLQLSEIDDTLKNVNQVDSRYRRHPTTQCTKVRPMCCKYFALSPRAPSIINLAICGFPSSTVSLNLNETGFRDEIIVRLDNVPKKKRIDEETLMLVYGSMIKLKANRGQIWFHLHVEIFTNGTHNVISITDAPERIQLEC